MEKGKSHTVKEATEKLIRFCVYRERCHQEVEQKLDKLHMIPAAKEEIITTLLAEGFLNEERFAKAFAYDKFNLQKWGRHRITRELKQRQVSDYLIRVALNEIDEHSYRENFEDLAQKRWRQLKDTDLYKKRKKLADFLMRKGYEADMIFSYLDDLEVE